MSAPDSRIGEVPADELPERECSLPVIWAPHPYEDEEE